MNPFKCKLGRFSWLQLSSSLARTSKLSPTIFLYFILALALPAQVLAADSESQIIHKVVEGDTLISLAAQYLDDPDAWPVLQRDNKVKNPRRLVPGSEILIHLPARDVTVIFAHGDVTLAAADDQRQAIEIGQKLAEGAKIRVGENSYLSLQFADGSITRVMSNSLIQLIKVRDHAKPASRIIELQRGAVDVSVTPQDKNSLRHNKKANTFEIMTPGAIAAVRGTRYDVTVSDSKDTTSGVTEGSVGVSPRSPENKNIDSVALKAGTGIPVDASGKLGSVRALLPAPDVSQLKIAVGDPLSVVLTWPELQNARAYQVRIAQDADMQQVLQNKVYSNSIVKLAGLADGTYSAGIRAIDEDGILGQEARQSFDIKANPAFPFFISPASEQIVSQEITFDCTPVSNAVQYHLQISQDPDFATKTIDADNLEACHYTASGLENGNYYWRVAAIATLGDGSKNEGPFSSPSSFTVDTAASESTPDEITAMYWIGEPGQTYSAEISRDEAFSEIVRNQEVSKNTIDLYGLPAGSYYIRLQAKDDDQPTGRFSTPRRFELKAPERIMQRTWTDSAK